MNFNGFKKRNNRGRGGRYMYVRSYSRPGGRWVGSASHNRGPNWPAILLILAVVAVVALIIWGVTTLFGGERSVAPTPAPSATAAQPSPVPTAKPIATPKAGSSEELPILGGQDAVVVTSKEANMSQPGAYGNILVYGAGTGKLSTEMVLTSLYQLDLDTGEEAEFAEIALKNSEITSTLMDERWIVWVETIYGAESLIRRYDRQPPPQATETTATETTATDSDAESEMEVEPYQQLLDIRTVADVTPEIAMYDDILLLRDRTEENEDRIMMIDLNTGEDLSIARLTDPASYGVSNPSIWGDQIIWAARDPDQTAEERAQNAKSVICYAEISKMGEYDTDEEGYIVCPTWKADMYVHRPLTNGTAWAWIDANGGPDSSLWVRHNGQVTKVADGMVTTFGLSTNYLVYGRNETVWAYSLKDKTYTRLSSEDEIMPIGPLVYGDRVVWITDVRDGKDAHKTLLLP